MSVLIRVARADEVPEVLALAVAFYAEDGFTTPARELAANLRVLMSSPAARVAVAVSEAAEPGVVGFAVTTTSFGLENGLIAELEDLFVVPSRRGAGVGRALIEDSVAWAAGAGCHHVELVVAPNGQDVSHLFDLYARFGFDDGGRRLLVREF